MALPTNVSFGTVTGTFLLASADSPADQDRDPEGTAATDLTFTFTPDLSPAVARDASATPPTMFALLPVSATVGQDGSLLGPDGAPGVRLVASTNTNLQPNGWTWKVELKSNTFPAMSFSFLLDPAATIDLSTVLQVPANPGGTLNAWLQAVSDAQAARDAALAAAASVPSAASLAATYPALNSSQRLAIGGTQLDPAAIGADAAGAAAAVQAAQGATIGLSSLNSDGSLHLAVTTPWGIRADGTAYYNTAGAPAGEQAVMDINPTTGAPRLTLIAS